MQKKNTILLSSLIFLLVSWVSEGLTLEKDTHEYLNQQIAQRIINGFSLDGYLKITLGFQRGIQELLFGYSEAKKSEMKRAVLEWVGEGGINEDEPESIPRQLQVGRATRIISIIP